MNLKTITLEKLITFRPCYSRKRLKEIRGDKEHWSALDILALDDVPKHDRMWAVLRPELIDEMLLHEFACRCAERALSFIDDPDPRSVRAIEVKRAWMRGEATDAELDAARDAAWVAALAAPGPAALAAAWAAAWSAAENATRGAEEEAEEEAEEGAAGEASEYAALAATLATSRDVAGKSERQWQVDELKKMLTLIHEGCDIEHQPTGKYECAEHNTPRTVAYLSRI